MNLACFSWFEKDIRKHCISIARTGWVLSLDLYIPSFQTAIEYQGIQHYMPVEFFGGEEDLIERRELELQKKNTKEKYRKKKRENLLFS